jgi:hypothetical protein
LADLFARMGLMVVVGILFSGVPLAQELHPFAAFDIASKAVLNDPHDLAIGPDGRLYVADKFASEIAVFNAETLELEEVMQAGRLPGVHDISFGANGQVAIAITGLGAVAIFDDFGSETQPTQVISAPRTEGALVHSNGNIYATVGALGAVVAFDGREIFATAGGHSGAHDVDEDLEGNIWVADTNNRRLVKYSPDLKHLQTLNAPKYGFIGPRYLDVDDFGRLVVADQDAHRILLIDPNGPDGGTLIGVLGDGAPGIGPNKFDDPEGVAVDGGRYYIADSDNNRIVRYSVVIN